jgi:hypothetical protein
MKKILLVVILCAASLWGVSAVAIDLGAVGNGLQGYIDGTQRKEALDRENRRADLQDEALKLQIARDRNRNSYGSRNSNSYSSYGNGYSGYNSNTGSTWNSNSYGSGNYGTDSKGNAWSYDRNTGIYQNYGTGERRYRGQRQ